MIINEHMIIDDRLQALKNAGYTLTFSWVKKSAIGELFYMKRKRIYRIQVSPHEFRGNYPIAWYIEVPTTKPNTKDNISTNQ